MTDTVFDQCFGQVDSDEVIDHRYRTTTNRIKDHGLDVLDLTTEGLVAGECQSDLLTGSRCTCC
ncbi:hypothetical protein D8S78_15625 [Natrialba swarupiae]|nr:hypothetical protein [Natrialba swarupiae]